MKRIPIALQMYTLREASEKDFAGTLRRVAEMGYDGVELAGYGGLTALEVRELLDTYGLRAAACHVPLHDLTRRLDVVLDDMKVLGSKYVVCPFLTAEERNETFYRTLISRLDEIGAVCREKGISLCYHNHDFELARLSDGRTALETILDDTDAANVQAEFDVYWLAKRGESPVEWLHKYRGRTPLVHLKDMTTDGEKFFAELGTGGVDIDSVLKWGRSSNVDWWIVEQDDAKGSLFTSVASSLAYLKKKGM